MSHAQEIYTARPTAEEMDDVLNQALNGVVATINPDGSIHLAYVLFLYESGKLYWETRSTTRKARNLAADPTISFIVEGAAATGTHLMAFTTGSSRTITGTEAHEINHRLRAKYVTDDALDVVNNVWDDLDDVCIEGTPARWRTWTGKKLGQVTMAAFGDAASETIWRET
jgi:nitroimidazol reductase NimA-like FMN-containing flavoprotein (pyridoxamine 5'-phosphate oxidase superfamily)